MRKIIIGSAAAALGVSTVLAGGASAGGNGAAHLWLQPTTTSDSNQCDQSTSNGNTDNGFANINAPGPPDAANFFNGEVSLKNAAPNAPYMVYVANAGDNSSCKLEGPIMTNGQGNGNLHLDDQTLANGDFYVVIRDATNNEVLATNDATIH